MKVLVAQVHLLLCDPMDCSLPGSSVHGILQVRTLQWLATSFSRGCPDPGSNWVSCITGGIFTVWVNKEAHLSLEVHLYLNNISFWGFPGGASGKESACWSTRRRFNPWVRKIPWKRKWQPTPVFLPGQFHGQRSLAGYSQWESQRAGYLRDWAEKS